MYKLHYAIPYCANFRGLEIEPKKVNLNVQLSEDDEREVPTKVQIAN